MIIRFVLRTTAIVIPFSLRNKVRFAKAPFLNAINKPHSHGKAFASRWLYSEKHHRAISRQANLFKGVEDFHLGGLAKVLSSSEGNRQPDNKRHQVCSVEGILTLTGSAVTPPHSYQ